MRPRRIIVGCAVVAVLFLAVAVIGGLLTVRRLMSPVPLAEVSSFIDEGTRAVAILRLQRGEAWLDNFSRPAPGVRISRGDLDDALPLEAIWSLQTVDGEPGQMLGVSLSRRGRLFGMALDFALWKIGRESGRNVSRVEYGDEGITSFPGTNVDGHVFARGNQLVWASSLETARKAVDLLRRPESAVPPGAVEALSLPEFDGFLSGAATGGDPLMRWGLSLLAGEDQYPPEAGQPPLLEGLSFTLRTTSPDEATGQMTLRFRPGVDAGAAQRAAARAAANLSSASVWEMTLKASARPEMEGARAILDLHVTGLARTAARLLSAVTRLGAELEKAQVDGLPVIRID